MNWRYGIILCMAVGAAWLVWAGLHPGNAYASRDAGLGSAEAREALTMLRQLGQSTNHLKTCMAEGAPPMAQLEVLRVASQLGRARTVELSSATWQGEYLSVGVACAGGEKSLSSHHFYFQNGTDGKLELVGVHR